jgi:hypothetical protein
VKIKNYQDFYAGVMFIIFGGFTMFFSTTYNMGTAARMGPGYFPFWLGGVLALLGAIVLFKSLGTTDKPIKAPLRPLVIFISMMLFSIAAGAAGASPNGALAIGTIAGCVLAFFLGLRALGLVLGAVTIFGLFLKGLGLVICTLLLVVIASLASHEKRWTEVIALYVGLTLLCIGVFIYGIKLQIPVWPDAQELTRMFASDKKK